MGKKPATTVAGGHRRSRDGEDDKQPIARSRDRINLVGAEGNKEVANQDLG